MEDLEKKDNIYERVEALKEKMREIVNKGAVDSNCRSLQETFERNQKLKELFEYLEYNLQRDLSDEELNKKLLNVENKLKQFSSEYDNERE